MPKADTTFIIGVQRELEKSLLEVDEFTRLIEADDAASAAYVLADTPYGRWISDGVGVEQALRSLDKHRCELLEWLDDAVDDERVTQFISAPYDGLNAATALLQKMKSADEPGLLSDLGHVRTEVWQSTIWNNVGWEQLPKIWEEFVRAERDSAESEEVIVERCGRIVDQWMEQLKFTKLMREVLKLRRERQRDEKAIRPVQPDFKGIEYEQKWDKRLLEIIKPYRFEVEGYDSIISFWYAKELEAKILKLLLSAKNAGITKEELRQVERPLYRSLA